MTWIIKKVNRIPTHCGVAYESVCLLVRGHVIRVWGVGGSVCTLSEVVYMVIPGQVVCYLDS